MKQKFINKDYLEETLNDYDREVIEPIRELVIPKDGPGNYYLTVKEDGSVEWTKVE